MDRSNVAEASLFSESADEAQVLPLNNSSDKVATVDQGFEEAENYWKYLIFHEKKDRSLQTMEYDKSSEPGEVLSSSNESHSTPITESETACKISNMSETSFPHNRNTSGEEEKAFDTNSSMTAGGSQQANKIERRRKSVVFTSKRKLSFRGADNEEFDDSGVVLNNSNEITSPVESDSAIDNKMSTLSESPSCNHNTPHQVSMDTSSKNYNTAAEKLRATDVGRRRKLFASKRKLSSGETEDVEFDESGKRANKRGRGKYKLRDLSSNDLPDNVNQKEPKVKRAQNKSTKYNSSQADTEDEIEDSAAEEKTANHKTQKEDKLLAKNQAAHNHQILKLINEGSPAKLRTLSRVGLKTAMMIHQYRKLNGKLESIRDLENMSGWSPKFFELFLSANNIVLD